MRDAMVYIIIHYRIYLFLKYQYTAVKVKKCQCFYGRSFRSVQLDDTLQNNSVVYEAFIRNQVHTRK